MQWLLACLAGGIVIQREQSFGRGNTKPCREWEGDTLTPRFGAHFSCKSRENGRFAARTHTPAKTIPPATQAKWQLGFSAGWTWQLAEQENKCIKM